MPGPLRTFVVGRGTYTSVLPEVSNTGEGKGVVILNGVCIGVANGVWFTVGVVVIFSVLEFVCLPAVSISRDIK